MLSSWSGPAVPARSLTPSVPAFEREDREQERHGLRRETQPEEGPGRRLVDRGERQPLERPR
jgi:hypothetical protein